MSATADRYPRARRIYQAVKRPGWRVLTLPEIQRVLDADDAALEADDRAISRDADRCPECGGYGRRGCGAAWHDGKPDTHCSPACQCRDEMRAELRAMRAEVGR